MALTDGIAGHPEQGMSAPDARAAAQGGASLLVLQTIGRLLGLLFVVIVTRHLPPDQFGRYSTVAAVVLLGNFLADFGTSAAITRLVSRSPEDADELLSGTLLGSLGLGLLSYAGVLVFATVSYSSTTAVDMAIGALAIPCAAMLSSLLGALDGKGMIARRASISALQTFTVAAGAVPVLFGAGVRSALVAMALAPMICLLLAGGTAYRAGAWSWPLRLDPKQSLALLRTAAPYGLTGGLAALTMRFDVVLLSLVSSAAETARYDLALRLLEACTYLSTAFSGPLLFLLSRRLGSGDRDGAQRAFTEAVRLLYLLGLPLSMGLALLARPFVSIALGAEFSSAALPLAIMGAAQWVTWLICTQSALVMAGDSMRQAVRIGLWIAAATVVLDLCLVPPFGATGAAIAMVVSWAFSAVILHQFARRTTGVATVLPSARVVIPTVCMGVVVAGLRGYPLLVPVVAGILTYALGVSLSRAFTPTDFQRLLRLVRRRPATAPS
ncbi:MAG: oligosaccharide flippase family protein [Acidimicrobiales bacterium]